MRKISIGGINDPSANTEESVKLKTLRGTALTINGLPPACDEMLALRHPKFGDYRPEYITCDFIQGDLNGPQVLCYEYIDYIAWFLSEKSSWIPKHIREYLLEGFSCWPVWYWSSQTTVRAKDFVPNRSTGALFHAMYQVETFAQFKLSKDCVKDIETRFDYTINLLGLPENSRILATRFLNKNFIEKCVKQLSKTKS